MTAGMEQGHRCFPKCSQLTSGRSWDYIPLASNTCSIYCKKLFIWFKGFTLDVHNMFLFLPLLFAVYSFWEHCLAFCLYVQVPGQSPKPNICSASSWNSPQRHSVTMTFPHVCTLTGGNIYVAFSNLLLCYTFRICLCSPARFLSQSKDIASDLYVLP